MCSPAGNVRPGCVVFVVVYPAVGHRILEFLEDARGRWFCVACIAVTCKRSVGSVREGLAALLAARRDVDVAPGPCSACGRTTEVARCTGRVPPSRS